MWVVLIVMSSHEQKMAMFLIFFSLNGVSQSSRTCFPDDQTDSDNTPTEKLPETISPQKVTLEMNLTWKPSFFF